MTYNEKQHDAERGILTPHFTTSPLERFLLFRDIAFVSILLLHLGSAISAIPTLVTRTAPPSTHGYLAIVIITGVLAPILCVVGYRSHLRISKVTSAMWFEVGWVTILTVVDFIIAVSYSTLRNASKTMVGLTFTQMIFAMIYAFGLGGMILLQHRRFPEVNIWYSSVHTVQWLRSSTPIDPKNPSPTGPVFVSASGPHPKQWLAPWNREHEDMHEVKLNDNKSKFSISPMLPSIHDSDAHPFWQERVQRQVTVEDNMAYAAERYGLSLDLPKPKPQIKHGRRPSIRDLEISRPVPVVTTVRRANTLASAQFDMPRRPQHQRAGSMNTHDRGRPTRGAPPPALRLHTPETLSPISPVLNFGEFKPFNPMISPVAPPEPAPEPVASTGAKLLRADSAAARAQGLAGRTLVGTSRPKASGTRAAVDISKPLPSPPPMSTDESLTSSGLSSQSGTQFVMSIAQRVKVGATRMRPMIISTPNQGELSLDNEKTDDIYWG